MVSSYVILTLYVVVLYSGRYAIHDAFAEEEADALSVFIRLHRQFCPSVSLCTYDALTADVDVRLTVDESCCYPCRCDASCSSSKQCCPDLPASASNKSFENPSGNKIMEVEGTSNEEETNVEITPETSDDHFARIRERAVCVEQQVAKKFKAIEHGRAYLMVWSCPEKVESPKAYQMCLNFEEIGGGEVTGYLPVTSDASNITYRNRYCLECNEGKNVTYLRWKPTLICVTNIHDTVMPAIQTFTDLIHYIRSFDINPPCNLLYIPPEPVSVFLVECIYANISSCNVTGNWKEYDPAIDKACTSFNSPIDSAIVNYDAFTLTTFQNIACFICNAAEYDQFITPCRPPTHYMEEEHHVVELFDGTDFEDSSFQYGIDDDDQEDVLSMYGSTDCEKGLFKDKYQGNCRVIQCPRDHVMYKRNCVPIFWTLHGLKIRLDIEVRLSRTFFEGIEGFAKALDKAFKIYMDDREFAIFDYSIWYKMRTKTTVDYFYYTTLLETNETFSSVLNRLSDIGMGKQILGRMYDLNNNTVEYSVSFTENIELVSWAPIELKDMVDDKMLTLLVELTEEAKYGVSIPVRTTSYCMRVQLRRNEFKLQNGELQIRQGHFAVERHSFDLISDKMAFVCIDEYNKGKDTDETRAKATEIDTMKEAQESSLAFLLGCAAMTGGVIAVFIVVSVFRKLYQVRLQTQSPHATTMGPEINPGSYI